MTDSDFGKLGAKFDGRNFARLLRAIAASIEDMETDEIVALLNDPKSFSRKKSGRNQRESVMLKLTAQHTVDLPNLANTLQTLNTREEGVALMESASLTRRELEALARFLRVPVMKTDPMGRLTEKVIESTIGARLNSAAIRGAGERPSS